MLHDLADDGAELGGELGSPGRRDLVLDRVGLDPQHVTGAGPAGTDAGTADARDENGGHIVALDLLDLGDGAHGCEVALDPGDEEETPARRLRGGDGATRLGAFDGNRDDHVREHDPVAQRENGECERREITHRFEPFKQRWCTGYRDECNAVSDSTIPSTAKT